MDFKLLIENLAKGIIDHLFEGGPGSGNWAHAGRPGEIGGSSPGGGGSSAGARGILGRAKGLDRSGGFSFRPWGSKTPKDGYIVSRKGHGINFSNKINEDQTRAWVKKEWSFVEGNSGRYFGGWVDGTAKKAYLDISEVFSDKGKAVSLAKRTGELAIWDAGSKQEIRV
jgi:hypothetical protein